MKPLDNLAHRIDADPADAAIATRFWRAHLQLVFEAGKVVIADGASSNHCSNKERAKTKIKRATHIGPLRIQRPFYPEGNCCHCYVLHPPGGIVTGDHLTLEATLGNDAQVLITTPSAGKVYTSDRHGHPQHQGISAKLASNSCLEWLPQETIIFSGAQVELRNQFILEKNANLVGWDLVCLGRRASGETFDSGQCAQLIEIVRDNKLLMRERTQWQGGSAMLNAPWGMGGNSVSGTLFATIEASRQQLDDWREGLQQLNLPGEWGMSQKPGVFLARYLGQSAEQGRRGFEYLWKCLRPQLNGREVCRPRIWNT